MREKQDQRQLREQSRRTRGCIKLTAKNNKNPNDPPPTSCNAEQKNPMARAGWRTSLAEVKPALRDWLQRESPGQV
jgi:hypothetical protein